jgi:NADPH:quinone reductase-like Zn-dependent oxidoreductase
VRHTRIIVIHYGGPDALQVLEEECPEPKRGEVRVRVLAAGVSLPDLMMREGIHPETPPLPFTPGWDLIGIVDRLGDGVSGVEPGQIPQFFDRLAFRFSTGAGPQMFEFHETMIAPLVECPTATGKSFWAPGQTSPPRMPGEVRKPKRRRRSWSS